ncbi:MAG TPA: hypothetical protein VMW69_13470, partial [Spirochaetia bacterium]|nr:hypothetical protein [Spirochaetia bacterium]
MTAIERHTIVSHSKGCSRTLEGIEGELLSYGQRKGLFRTLLRLYEDCAELWEGLPEGWEGRATGMLAAGAVAGSTQNVAGFLRSKKETLPPEQAKLIRLWRSEPWRYALYLVDSEEGDDLLNAVELDFLDSPDGPLGESDLLIYSPASAASYREGRGLFFALLWWNGFCYQTYGPVVPFRSITAEDVAAFTRELIRGRHAGRARRGGSPISTDGSSMRQVMMRDPIPYLALVGVSEAPTIVVRGSELVSCNGWVEGVDADFDEILRAIEGSGEQVEVAHSADGIDRIGLEGKTLIPDPVIYFAQESKTLHVVGLADASYERARAALASVVALPKTPQRRFGAAMQVAVSRILGGESEVDRLAAAFEELDGESDSGGLSHANGSAPTDQGQDASFEKLPDRDQLEAIMARLIEGYNQGREESDEEIGRSLALDPGLVGPLREELSESLDRMLSGAPEVDRFGLSPAAFHELNQRGLPALPGVLVLHPAAAYTGEGGVLELIEAVPLVRGSRWLLDRIARDGGLRSTKAGKLPVSVVEEAFQSGQIVRPDDGLDFGDRDEPRTMFHPRREDEWQELAELHRILEALDLLSDDGKRFEVTAEGAALRRDPLALHRTLLEGMLRTLEWRVGSRAGSMPELEEGAGFLLYAASRLTGSGGSRSWVRASRLTEGFLAARPWVV